MGNAWRALSRRQQVMAGGAVAGVVGLFAMMTMIARQPEEALLMSGLSPEAAGEVAAELDGLGVPYSVRGTAIHVPEADRDRLRLALAQQGLPRADEAGYELLDSLDGFSTTADMFDAAYWRAKEGELARTIRAIPGVTAARVHLGVGRQSAFRRASDQKTASVTVESGIGLSDQQARSIQTLTALAVSGLSADQVAVIDSVRGIMAGPGARDAFSLSGQESRAADLEARLTRMLEARVGEGKARVSVALDVERMAVSQTERVVDPDGRQVAARSTLEESETENPGASAVTVASNLPEGDIAPEEGTPVLRRKRSEDVTYTGTEIERHTETLPGGIKRLSVAVLLDEATSVNEAGEVVPSPRTPEELDALRALVASAAGIDEARGDTLALRTLPFVAPEPIAADASNPFIEQIAPRTPELLKLAFLGAVALVLGLFVVRPLLTARQEEAESGEPKALPQDAAGLLTVLVEESPEDAAAVLDAWFDEDRVQIA
ncbi:flagellar basal-body MS-ring/collar protein FliF [Parvularcula oceani]|uniref:flagellar basal-body MS-ring/collar protein FliF n=1 Tax=Parvularcula oceani TaxID=1247963 RepID=UPI00068F004F|nr:flagellar basal-body MS-ring/collar protein FliF [Parvularcula oceani]